MSVLDLFAHQTATTSPKAQSLRSLLSLRKSRAALAEMTDAQLRDIGVTRAEAMQEAGRPFWDIPHLWRASNR